MSALSLSSLDAKIEAIASSAVAHVRQSVDFKGRIEKLESGAKPDLDALKDDILDSVKTMLSDLRTEIIGEVKAEVSDNVGAVEKAVADLTSPAEPEPSKADAPATAPVVPATPAGPAAPVI